MPKIATPLSARQIDTAKPKEKNYTLSDGRGLYLLIKSNGSKIWRMEYTFNGKRYLASFGDLKSVSLSQARSRRDEWYIKINQGINPLEEKRDAIREKELENTGSFENVCKEYLNFKLVDLKQTSGGMVQVTHNKHIARLNLYVFQSIGKKHIKDVTDSDIENILLHIQSKKIHEPAKKIWQLFCGVWKYAVGKKYCARNITADMDISTILKPRKAQQHKTILDLKRIGELLRAIDSYGGDYSTLKALQFLPYVFVRSQTLRSAKWADIDFEKAVWRIPSEDMKMSERFVMPLSRQALQILKDIHQYTGGEEYIFYSDKSKSGVMSENTLNQSLKRLGFSDITTHGFRSMFDTILNEYGDEHNFNAEHLDKALAHTEKNKQKATYNRAEYVRQRKDIVQHWADFLDGLKGTIADS